MDNSTLLNSAHQPISAIFTELRTDEKGLEQNEVKKRLKQFGPNQVAEEKKLSWYSLLLRNIKNPFVILLIVLSLISFFLKQYDSVIIMSVMVLISVGIRFFQEYRSNNAAEQLKALVSVKASVLRRSHLHPEPKLYEINVHHLVPGDIVHLSSGDMIPADLRIISAKELSVDQSALTGESLPVEKESKQLLSSENPFDMPNLCFMGSYVESGSAQAVVLKTGRETYFGQMSANLVQERPLTGFDIGINKISWLLIKFVLIMVPIVFLINYFTKHDWLEALLFSLSVAVGLTPEMLPMIVTTNLAIGALDMARSKVIVKNLNAIQNFGAMDVLCTDKTGTLTHNQIILEKYLDAEGKESQEVLKFGYLNSHFQTGLKNIMDLAVLTHKEVENGVQEYKKIDELPFDFNRRRMSVIVKNGDQHLLICKGAVEEILSVCTQIKKDNHIIALAENEKQALEEERKRLSQDGLRVLALAYKDIHQEQEYHASDENNLIFLGYLAFLDPPKRSAANAIQQLHEHGVEIKILTGDNELVTQKICKWVNLPITEILNGSEIDALTDEQLKERAKKANVFAKVSPIQKSRIIASLKAAEKTVGYLGDGINDAPALREADIGISVDNAVDIAKESADIIMLEKNLMFLVEGVLEGRKVFGNIIKYIKMALSSNFGNMFSVLGASAILPFLPMLSVQILLQNLLYDISQLFIPFDHVDEEFLDMPHNWDPRGIGKFILFIGPISSIFDYVTFAVMWFVFAANSLSTQALFQSGWFVEGLLSQTLIVHMIRTRKIPFIQSIASMPLLLATFVIMAIGIIIPYTFIGAAIGLKPLPTSYFYWLTAILLSYCLLTQLVKIWFIKRFKYWL